MKGYVDLTGLDALVSRVAKLRDELDARDLMVSFEKIIVEDNRRGVLAGLDKDGNPMDPVTYRPKGKAARPTPRQRNNAKGRRGVFGGLGPMAAGYNNNLTSAEYRRLGGPPLAPRKGSSRVVTNLETHHQQVGPHAWEAYGFWRDVVDVKGRKFLHHLFKRRDLRGVRPAGREKARRAAIAWMSDRVRYLPRGGSSAA